MRTPVSLAAAGLLLALSARAQAPRPASAEGAVLHSVTLEPLPHVQVGFQPIVERAPGRSAPRATGAVTGSDGQFRVENLAPGDYRVTLRREGFGIPRSTISSLRLKLEPGAARTGLRFFMSPQASVSGRVLDEFGEPVSGAIVQLARRVAARGATSDIPGHSASTDDLGNFHMPAVEPGRYVLQAVHADSREVLYPEPGGAVTAYAPTYSPSTTDPQQAEIIDARAGEEAGPAVVRLRREPVFSVRGRVLDTEGNPIPNAQLFLRSTAGFSIFLQPGRTRVLPDGRFELLGVPRGDWILTAFPRQRPAEAPMALSTRITVSQAPLEGVVVQAAPLQRITGTAVFEGEGTPDWRAVNIVVRPSGEAVGLASNAGRPGPDGAFELSASGQGMARLDIVGLPAAGSYVASVQSGSVDITRRAFPLEQGLPAPLRIVFRGGAARIEGQLENRKPATVLLWPAEAEAREAQPLSRAEATPTGAFSFSGLAPGAYLLYAVQPEDPLAFGPGAAPADLEQRATRVRVEPGSTARAALSLQEER